MYSKDPNELDHLDIGLASPDKIRYWSHGEVEKPETINYRTFKPERKGLFCEKIFGPVKDWECSCGKYRRIRYRGIVCERCGVEVTHSKVRRERMGHIELASPVTHIWFLKGIPGYLSTILDLTTRQLEEVIYYDSYIIINIHESLEGEYSKFQLVSTSEAAELKEKYQNKITLDIGAIAIKTILSSIDLNNLVPELREAMRVEKGQKKMKIIKRLRILEPFLKSKNSLEWLILDVIPIMPPDLRPMVHLDGGRFATSDLNDLYRRVVNRNNRLKRLLDIGAPDMIIRNEKRMLQESIDVLIANGKRGRSVTGSNGRPLKSLGNIIEGKQGRFRQNLLGKRVDYSARSVIVVGPNLNFTDCGLPKEMAMELFKPFVIRKLVEQGIASNVKSAKRKIEHRSPEVWMYLEEVIKGKLVLLNRAPTLHRLGIQAFQPTLVEGSAIQVHPLVCTAFNADFDGDQMAVHLPLSIEAQTESKLLIQSTNNILSPSSGKPIITPSQDMVLGCYYLTVDTNKSDPVNTVFKDIDEVKKAFELNYLEFHSKIKLSFNNNIIETTVGRVIFNDTVSKVLLKFNKTHENFVNTTVGKKQLSDIIYDFYITHGNIIASELADSLKTIGFKYSTLSGISIAVDDLTIPEDKSKIIMNAKKDIDNLNDLHEKGIISQVDKTEKSNDIWRSVTQNISTSLSNTMGELNNVFIMANSGARGNMDQVRQLAGMRGLMSDSQGRTIEIPILHNFKEGLTLTEYFISAYGARKGLVDTALRTADSGYLTRRLVDVAQDVMIMEEDCGTTEGIRYKSVKSGIATIIELGEVIEGRYALEDVYDNKNKCFIKAGEIITKDQAELVDKLGIESVLCRSIYKCKTKRGICQKCYGIDLSTAQQINIGEAIGIIAAQSIGEPGTQLTMRTFHTGGVDLRKASLIQIHSPLAGELIINENVILSPIQNEGVKEWIVVDDCEIEVKSDKKTETINLYKGTKLFSNSSMKVKKGEVVAEYDPNDSYFFSISSGEVLYEHEKVSVIKNKDGIDTITAIAPGEILVYDKNEKEEIYTSKATSEKLKENIIVDAELSSLLKIDFSAIILKIELAANNQKKSEQYKITIAKASSYPFGIGSVFYIDNNESVSKNTCLFKLRLISDISKTEDIVQGLPKVEELFEARKPKEPAILAENSGEISIFNADSHWLVRLLGEESQKEYKISKNAVLNVVSGQKVKTGDMITNGPINLHDLGPTIGLDGARCFLSDEVQKVYRTQGVQINKKHIETIVRQMTKKVTVTDMGDTTFLLNEMVDLSLIDKVNQSIINEGKQPAKYKPVLLGITRASLNTDSFVSASSFQQTASVLTKAAIQGQQDLMVGLKENVIIGKLIPAGTGIFSSELVNVNKQLENNDLMDVDTENENENDGEFNSSDTEEKSAKFGSLKNK